MVKKASVNQAKYDKEKMERYYLKLHKANDKDIIDKIDPNNKQGSIKKLIRKGIEKDQQYIWFFLMKYFSLITTYMLLLYNIIFNI